MYGWSHHERASRCRDRCAGPAGPLGWGLGGYTGWVIGGLYRVLPSCLAHPPTSDRRERALGRAQGGSEAGWAYTGLGTAAGTAPGPPCGPGQAARCPPCPGPSECRLTANRARFHLFPYKVSQNREVSPVFVEKACHSPCFQNGPGKSALEILRFP